jgi:hypothetical protein
MPIADHFVAARIHVDPRLAREEQHHERGEKHHVSGQPEEHKKPDSMQALAWSAMLALPVVIASATPTTRRSPVYRGFSAYSGFFPFNFRWGSRKGNGHSRPRWCCCRREITPTLGWTHAES